MGPTGSRVIALLVLLATPSALAAQPNTTDTRMLAQPAVSATQLAFVYAGDLWTARLDGPTGPGQVAITGAGGTKGAETVLSITLVPNGDKTLLKLVHKGFADEESRNNHLNAWPMVLEMLENVYRNL